MKKFGQRYAGGDGGGSLRPEAQATVSYTSCDPYQSAQSNEPNCRREGEKGCKGRALACAETT